MKSRESDPKQQEDSHARRLQRSADEGESTAPTPRRGELSEERQWERRADLLGEEVRPLRADPDEFERRPPDIVLELGEPSLGDYDLFSRILPLAMAICCAFLLPAVLNQLLAAGELRALILERGLAQRFTLAIFGWGLGHCLRLWLLSRGEERLQRSLEGSVDSLLQGGSPKRSALLDFLSSLRASRAGEQGVTAPYLLEVMSYFQSERPSREEARAAAARAEDEAFERLERERQPLAATLWLLPLNGFLGTVIGMSQSIRSFDQLLTNDAVGLGALGPSVAGLATAFDTTLLALALVFPLKLLEVTLDRRAQRQLDRLSSSFGGGLIQRLDLRGLAQRDPLAEALEQLSERVDGVERSFEGLVTALRSLNQELGALQSVPTVFRDLSKAARGIELRLPRSLDRLDETNEQLSRELPAFAALAEHLQGALGDELPRAIAHLAALEAQGEAPLVLERKPREKGGQRR